MFMTRNTLLRLMSATAIVGALAIPALVGAAYAEPEGSGPAAAEPATPATAVPPPPATGTPDKGPGGAMSGPHGMAPGGGMGPGGTMPGMDHANAGHANADRANRARAGMRATFVDRLFKVLDANNDGKISKDEFATASQHLFTAADSNHDGILTPLEMRRGMQIARQEVTGRGLMGLDTNHDGTISRDEFLARPEQIFARLDKNHDGKLDAGEIADAQRARMGHMRRMMQHMQGHFGMQGMRGGFGGGAPWRDANGHQGQWGSQWGQGHQWGRGADHDRRWGDRSFGGDNGGRHGAAARGNPVQRAIWTWLRRADTDHDGALSRAEAEAATTALFDSIDTNHDGSISKDELAQAVAQVVHAPHRNGPQHGGDR
jgi:Ca2+-binding EF-hand superfamily protein